MDQKMKVLERDNMKIKLLIYDEDDTMGNLIVHRLSRLRDINFASYKRSHYLDKPSSIELQYVLKKPDESIEKYFIQCLDELDKEVEKTIQNIS